MANRNGLRLIGWAYGGVTAMVVLTAFMVVSAKLNGRVEASPDSGVMEWRSEAAAKPALLAD